MTAEGDDMSNLSLGERSRVALHTGIFEVADPMPTNVLPVDMTPPSGRQYILRMPIRRPFGHLTMPEKIVWTSPAVNAAMWNQAKMGIRHPFMYITIRSGIVSTKTDDTWHVDGWSQQYTHIPEQNYTWCDVAPTQVNTSPKRIPDDFDSMKHNIHLLLEDQCKKEDTYQLDPGALYCMDPYVVHRRPPSTRGLQRTFVRVSFTPIEINDVNNAINNALPADTPRDGVADFRDGLVRY